MPFVDKYSLGLNLIHRAPSTNEILEQTSDKQLEVSNKIQHRLIN